MEFTLFTNAAKFMETGLSTFGLESAGAGIGIVLGSFLNNFPREIEIDNETSIKIPIIIGISLIFLGLSVFNVIKNLMKKNKIEKCRCCQTHLVSVNKYIKKSDIYFVEKFNSFLTLIRVGGNFSSPEILMVVPTKHYAYNVKFKQHIIALESVDYLRTGFDPLTTYTTIFDTEHFCRVCINTYVYRLGYLNFLYYLFKKPSIAFGIYKKIIMSMV